ncbi:MAG: DUF2817 domain-containing protein [Methylotetracoccus sp.]
MVDAESSQHDEAAGPDDLLHGLVEHLEHGAAIPELLDLLSLAAQLRDFARVEVLTRVRCADSDFPLIAICFGPDDPTAPVLALTGGVHGLERIGTRIVVSYLRTLMELARWDRVTQSMLRSTRIVMLPLVNPVGMFLRRRANGNGVDLMRNSPVRADGLDRWQLFGGHRISPRLPWYQGPTDAPMEPEARALCRFIRREVFMASHAISIDVHSGYGKVDRLWFPYAKTREPFPQLAEVVALKHLLDRTYPHHVYCVEPQSRQYLSHGDLWDYLYDEFRDQRPDGHFLPFTLELGSWLWVKKNWRQIFSRLGAFNPWLPHREQRALRRHTMLFDFLFRALQSPELWTGLADSRRAHLQDHGLRSWFDVP